VASKKSALLEATLEILPKSNLAESANSLFYDSVSASGPLPFCHASSSGNFSPNKNVCCFCEQCFLSHPPAFFLTFPNSLPHADPPVREVRFWPSYNPLPALRAGVWAGEGRGSKPSEAHRMTCLGDGLPYQWLARRPDCVPALVAVG